MCFIYSSFFILLPVNNCYTTPRAETGSFNQISIWLVSGYGPTHKRFNLLLEWLDGLKSEQSELRGWKTEFLFIDSNPYTKSKQISLSPSFALYSWQRKAAEHNLYFVMNNKSLMHVTAVSLFWVFYASLSSAK